MLTGRLVWLRVVMILISSRVTSLVKSVVTLNIPTPQNISKIPYKMNETYFEMWYFNRLNVALVDPEITAVQYLHFAL